MNYYTIKLKEMRTKHKISLRKLSAETNISRTELNNIELGRRDLRVSTLVILAKFFGCNLCDLINY